MIKLVAIDLDGTVVNENLEISKAALEALQRANRDHGVKVIIATGRMFPSSIPFARKLGITDPLICYQGGMIRDIAESLEDVLLHPILFHRGIEMDCARGIVDIVQAAGLHANIYVNDRLFTTQLNEKSRYYQNISGVVPENVTNLHDVLTGEPSKIMIIEEDCQRHIDAIRKQFGTQVSVCMSRRNYVEVVHATVSKWQAIENLMERWNIQTEEVMAIGDQENDLSMIMGAGVGVAMGNAPDHVKERANYVTGTVDEDGVVEALDKFVFGHLPLTDPPQQHQGSR